MVQKDQSGLSRRTVLKGLGMGAGLAAFGGLASGCTQFLSRSGRSVPLAPAKAGNITERDRLARQAYEAKEAWKGVLRDYYRWQASRDPRIKQGLSVKVQQAKQKALVLGDP